MNKQTWVGGMAISAMLLIPLPIVSAEETIEEVVVTGLRGKPRSVTDSPVPVDVFNAEAISTVSYSDTNNILQTLVPSYNVARQAISDGATFIRPAQLRGMPTDKTLVLLNSKRRHRAALVAIGGSGTQGPDVATIPSQALKSIEVLRDGAAAQYGSDAIAGVINFILKDNSEGGSFSIDSGEFFEGDGFQVSAGGNVGFALGDNGFVSLSGEITDSDFTSRSEQYCQTWFCLDQANPVYDSSAGYATFTEDPAFQAASQSASLESDVVQPWGQPNSESAKIFVNAGYDIDDNLRVYGFGNYSSSEADGSFFYRYPNNGTIEDLRLADGSIYSPLSIFPGGFTPRFLGEVEDTSFVGGISGELSESFSYDVSARYGVNEVQYTLMNTINPSLGPDTPTSFRPGDLENEEVQLQLDFTYAFDMGLDSEAVLAFGATYMDESYAVVQGNAASYEAGPFALADPFDLCDAGGAPTAAGVAVIGNGSTLDCSDSDDPVFQVVGVGSNGFPGYSPAFSEVYERDSYGIYADLSADVTDTLFLQGALRYEDYSDFDSELVGKVAMQFDFSDTIGVRASFGTGFRAPTPGQQGTTNVSTRLPNGFPVATGLFPPGSVVAQALGATALKPETSTSYTFGMTAEFDALSLTIDFYNIDVDDRFYAISTLDVSTDTTSGSAYANYLALRGAGVVGAESIGGVFYFTNAFDTSTQGVDVVATYPIEWDSGTTMLTASFNYNTTDFESDPSAFLNAEDAFDFENDVPDWRGVVSAAHNFGKLSLLGRVNLYGAFENSNNSANLVVQEYDGTAFVDLEGSYQVTDIFRVTVGGRNIFDEYPEQDEIGDFCCGRVYPSSSVVGWQGGYYYMRVSADF